MWQEEEAIMTLTVFFYGEAKKTRELKPGVFLLIRMLPHDAWCVTLVTIDATHNCKRQKKIVQNNVPDFRKAMELVLQQAECSERCTCYVPSQDMKEFVQMVQMTICWNQIEPDVSLVAQAVELPDRLLA